MIPPSPARGMVAGAELAAWQLASKPPVSPSVSAPSRRYSDARQPRHGRWSANHGLPSAIPPGREPSAPFQTFAEAERRGEPRFRRSPRVGRSSDAGRWLLPALAADGQTRAALSAVPPGREPSAPFQAFAKAERRGEPRFRRSPRVWRSSDADHRPPLRPCPLGWQPPAALNCRASNVTLRHARRTGSANTYRRNDCRKC
jgi:hypothetical protein